MNHFKSRVLEPSIKQINEHTDIIVTYEQHKKGRTITGFSFKFKQNNSQKLKKPLILKEIPIHLIFL
jgi:plasmid replication initiation protein